MGYYAIMDSALRYRQGLTVDQLRDQMAAMFARFSEIAVDNTLCVCVCVCVCVYEREINR